MVNKFYEQNDTDIKLVSLTVTFDFFANLNMSLVNI